VDFIIQTPVGIASTCGPGFHASGSMDSILLAQVPHACAGADLQERYEALS